ncbi:hypothetical protein R1sor_014055 [Riccia sorocarpa]|uniref:Integrase zinc-binding domain-containing protein n=1 Tax=Riccia sorocarpa TaxID=122646 RepID=A0ABD3HCH0_9MARC
MMRRELGLLRGLEQRFWLEDNGTIRRLLALLGMVANCNSPDITMLRWIAYIRSFNPELRHIAGKENVVADMLSRARYEGEDEMLQAAEEEDRKEVWCQVSVSEILPFKENLYGGKLRDIGFYLSTLERRGDWNEAEFKKIRQKAYGFLLRDGYLWKRPKRRDGDFLRVVDDEDTKLELLKEFHDTLWAGHRGVWATYTKLKERYWWKCMYNDVDKFVGSCLHCQFYSKVRHRDGLVPTYPPSIHFRWVLDLVMMPPGLWGMREEDLADAQEKLKQARLKNKLRFDKTHRLRPKQIKVGDWVLVYDSSLENQHSTTRKFSRRWFGPYVVLAVNDNATYLLRELDRTPLRLVVAGKRVKLFKRRDHTSELLDFIDLERRVVNDQDIEEDEDAEQEED